MLRGTALVGNGYGCNIGGLGVSAYVASTSLGDIVLVLRFLHELEASRYDVGYLRSIKPQNHHVSLYSSMRLTPITNPVPSRIPESSWVRLQFRTACPRSLVHPAQSLGRTGKSVFRGVQALS